MIAHNKSLAEAAQMAGVVVHGITQFSRTGDTRDYMAAWEDLPTPEKSIAQIEREQEKRKLKPNDGK